MIYRERDRAASVELALELLATGRVRGVPADHDPAELDAVLGPPDSWWEPPDTDRTLVRHFGLLEAYCSRSAAGEPWRNHLFVAQLWQLKKPLKWKPLGHEVRKLGYEVMLQPTRGLEADHYTIVESGSAAAVLEGQTVKVSGTDHPWFPRGVEDFNAVHRTVYRAIGRPEASWPEWLERQSPDADWLRTAERTVHVVLREHPSRAAAGVAFHAWLLRYAADVKAWPADEWAYREAVFAADHRDLPGVPAPDAVAAHCLAALPMDPEAAARLPTAWRDIAPADVRASTATRALLGYARDGRSPS